MNREGHVKRIYSEDQTTWVDVLRLDRIYVSLNGQAMWFNIDWADESSENPQAGRKYEPVIIEPPEGFSGQPITVNALTSITMSNGGQKYIWTFDNDDSNAARYTYKRRVPMRDDGDTFSGYGTWSAYLAKFNAYDADDSQYIDTTIIDHFTVSNNGQRIIVTINNEEPLDFIGNAVPSGGTIYRLDPFQTIVNVKWGGADWGIIKYEWTAGGGTDLDTRTRMTAPRTGAEMGWSRADSDGNYCQWRADDTGNGGSEAVKVNFKFLRENFPDLSLISFRLAALWYGEKGSGNITISFEVGKEEPEANGTIWSFPTTDTTTKIILSVQRNVSLQVSADADGQFIGYLVTNLVEATLG